MAAASTNQPDKKEIQKGSVLASCYEVQACLGEGAFGMVIKCYNTASRSQVAIKIIKQDPDHYRNAEKEIKILKELQILDPDQSSVVKWMGFFLHQDLICMEFELLDISLSMFMERRQFKPLSLDEVRPIVNQLSMALFYLMSIKIIHRDIKPDNIMVVDHKKAPVLVKLIDFGMASKVVDVCSCVVQTLWYRAPEVLLCGCYTESIDMWSLGLVAAELALGFVVFPAEDTYDMMKFIVESLGLPPKDTLHRGESTHIFFNVNNSSPERTWTLKTPAEIAKEFQHQFRDTRYVPFVSLEALLFSRISFASLNDTCNFVDLVMNMLMVDDNERIKPLDVLKHPFLYLEQYVDQEKYQNGEGGASVMTADIPQNMVGDTAFVEKGVTRVDVMGRKEVEELKKSVILSLETFLTDIQSERENNSLLGKEIKSMTASQLEMNLRWETLEEQAVVFQKRIHIAMKSQEEQQSKGHLRG
ncbi:homeodomain-interacting protein kinase 2-like isoform X1 [Synchiropus splendidus]|uniref:homeodomain-interacting protein kinase 2-like isoform X1 n=3 Tax=Synchiropus splendidus TaxID=270530 RepID=UPI00237D4D09|nr:homeodomain-interacting protein kinase 2-like isoform X1 [Synchiropus splendidus]